MYDQHRPLHVDASTHARDDQEDYDAPTILPSAQTKHKQPDAHQCKYKCSAADSKPRALYSTLLATMPAAKKLPESRSEAICKPPPHKPLGENLQNWIHTVITHVQDNQKDFEAPTTRPST